MQISFAVTAKLISAFVFVSRVAQFLYFLNPKFPVPSRLLCLYSPVYVGPVRKPHCLFSHEATQFCLNIMIYSMKFLILLFPIFHLPTNICVLRKSESQTITKTCPCNVYPHIYIFIAIALDESIFLDVLHFPTKNIKSRDLEATPMGGVTSKLIQ